MATKIIFLDIDGVLNCSTSTSKCTLIEEKRIITGIDNDKLKRLKEIVAGTGAIIVLTSSWKIGWERFNKSEELSHARYMDKKFDKFGMKIYDCTKDKLFKRGTGIKDWLKANFTEEESPIWIVIDDEIISDYDMLIQNRLVLTDFNIGLTDKNVKLAINMLKED